METGKPTIYLDHSATTPVRPEVIEAMLPWLREGYGNPGSVHRLGRAAHQAVDDARDQVAALINAEPRDVVFTSGGTEADNLALRGVFAASKGRRIIVSAVEHHAVLHTAEYLAKHEGADLKVAPVDGEGRVSPEAVEELLTGDTAIVSVMHANNETGTIQPVREIGVLCRERGVPFHSDAVQTVGKIPVDVTAMPLDLVAISGHKIYGPKGIGAFYAKRGTDFEPQAVGGAQEMGRRAGTENVSAIVGLGVACALAREELAAEHSRLATLRDKLEQGIIEMVQNTRVHGSRDDRLPHIVNVGFDCVEGESVLLALDMEGVAVSTGSACTSGSLDPSHVLLAMGMDYETAQSAVRFSLGRENTEEDVRHVLDVLPAIIERLRAASPLTPQQ